MGVLIYAELYCHAVEFFGTMQHFGSAISNSKPFSYYQNGERYPFPKDHAVP